MYTDTNKSLKSETGGRLRELRSITNQNIQKYHADYYRPDNVCLIICGQTTLPDLCRTVDPVLRKYLSDPSRAQILAKPFPRPFSTPIEKFQKTVFKELPFPAEDESSGGCLQMSWFGPSWHSFDDVQAVEILLDYLTRDAISPLRAAFVDVAEPLAASVGFAKTEMSDYLFTLDFYGIVPEQVGAFVARGSEKNIAETVLGVMHKHVLELDLDMERMKALMLFRQRAFRQKLESQPHDAYCDFAISEFLFGPTFGGETKNTTGQVLRDNMDRISRLERLQSWSEEQWRALYRKVFGECYVALLGLPSKASAEKLQTDETARLEAQKQELGEAGCAKHEDKLAAAEDENEIEPPAELIGGVKLPDLGGVRMIQCLSNSSSETCLLQIDQADGAQFADVTFFFRMEVAKMPEELIAVLPIWRDLAFEVGVMLPIWRAWRDLAFEVGADRSMLPIWRDLAFEVGGDRSMLLIGRDLAFEV